MLTVITGPPCSGKSAYAREHAAPGDIVIDLAAIITALGGDPVERAGDVLRVARAARITAIRSATICHRAGSTVWVIDTDPASWLRSKYQRDGGTIITLEASAAELHQRATAQGRPARVHQVIDDWLAARATAGAAAGGRSW
jgi:hypothetical protein